MEHVFIIGSKGIPASYGGFETFVDRLVSLKKESDIQYYVACISKDVQKSYEYRGARCFALKVPNIGPAKAVYYDLKGLRYCLRYIREHNLKGATIYILACRIGPFIGLYKKQLEKAGIALYVNPDGHEWKRDKWNSLIKKYWKLSEKLMVKNADLLICDSLAIEKYMHSEYERYNPRTIYISYGANIAKSKALDEDAEKWYNKHRIRNGEYYLIVGRFVPENNYETIIREFIASSTSKDLVLITNVVHDRFYQHIQRTTHFEFDHRVKFVGTVYDEELLKKIREGAFGYFHGHQVGGTNPSLLEALASTDLNILLDVDFNKEVAEDAALYFNKEQGNLACAIEKAEMLSEEQRKSYGMAARKRIRFTYSWEKIVDEYEKLFLKT